MAATSALTISSFMQLALEVIHGGRKGTYAPRPMSFPVGWRTAALALALLCMPGTARAGGEDAESYLSAASGLFARNEYEQALEYIRKARTQPSNGADMDASLALWEGLLLLHLGKKDEPTPHLELAFLLKPELALPAKLSPKIKLRVEEIRARVKKERAEKALAFRREPAPPPPPPPVQPEPKVAEVKKPEEEKPYLPSAELASRHATPVAPLVLGGVALGAGAAGAWFGLQSQDAVVRARAQGVQLDAASALGEANGQALAANVAFAVAGTAALAALVTLLVSR